MQTLQKSHFRYAKCQGGDMHSGQTLNLVCVDEKCDHRGLICPVCKMQSHNECHVLPVKIFLGQIRDLMTNTNNPDELNNLGAYLRTLDSTKKEMIGILKNQINELAELFKDLQIKIESTYIALRHNILIQSTLTTKLPTLLEDLLNGNCTDSFNLQKQFSKYCELIKYRYGKPKVTDKALSLVQHYKNLPERMKSQMVSSLSDYKKKLQQVSQRIQKEENTAQIVKQIEKTSKPVFSDTLKSTNAILNADKSEVGIDTTYDQGYACMQQTFTQSTSSITVEVLQLGQQNLLMIGVGNKNIFQHWNKQWDAIDKQKHLLCAYVHSDGGTSKQILEDQQNYQEFFFGTGQKVTVSVDMEKKIFIFKNSQLNEPFQIKVSQVPSNINQLKLVVGLSYGDKVRLSL